MTLMKPGNWQWKGPKVTHRVWPKEPRAQKLFPSHLFLQQSRWFYLFHALLGLIILYPYLESEQGLRIPWTLTLVDIFVMAVIVITVSVNHWQRLISLALAAPALLLGWLPCNILPCSEPIQLAAVICAALFQIYVCLLTLNYLLHANHVSSNEIYAAASLYLLLGMTWAVLYQLIELAWPDSFYIPPEHNIDGVVNWADFLFFSFVTLTTLGYGDIIPVSSQARSLAILEAITGVIFLAVMVSGVMGLFVSFSLRSPEKALNEKDVP